MKHPNDSMLALIAAIFQDVSRILSKPTRLDRDLAYEDGFNSTVEDAIAFLSSTWCATLLECALDLDPVKAVQAILDKCIGIGQYKVMTRQEAERLNIPHSSFQALVIQRQRWNEIELQSGGDTLVIEILHPRSAADRQGAE